jgi:hypothetical protein
MQSKKEGKYLHLFEVFLIYNSNKLFLPAYSASKSTCTGKINYYENNDK